ncbi:MAG TPA: hypothetical protein VNK67_03855 [Burkholderiales bacterium]|nr:hypothetical protein [Burkholderiales bacterium]
MLELRLIPPEAGSYRAAVRELHAQGHRRLYLWPRGALAEQAARQAQELGCEARFAVPEPCAQASAGEPAPCWILAETAAAALSALLLGLTDLARGIVVAPRTAHAWDARPLFLISIPKAGTHLLYSLAGAFGYHAGIVCPEWPRPRHWYCLEYSNSHTRATDFFIDSVRRSPFGNRHHPFATSPALFIYRNPLDILVSEANYYHRDGNAIFGGYLANRSFEERLLTLIDDPWLFGSFRDRLAGYVPWLEFPNVVPLSFEELVGPRGGGDDALQRRLIWSLQLKLHVPGSPEAFAQKVFDPESATFETGQIGSHRKMFTQAALQRFLALPQDFMRAFGYEVRAGECNRYSLRAEEFIRRPLLTADDRFHDTPILVETGCHGHNIVRYRGRYYGVREENLAALPEQALARLPSATEIAALRQALAFRASRIGRWQQRLLRLVRPPAS